MYILYSFLLSTDISFLQGSDKVDEDKAADRLQVSDNETINVFSIASGHLYERFLRYGRVISDMSIFSMLAGMLWHLRMEHIHGMYCLMYQC